MSSRPYQLFLSWWYCTCLGLSQPNPRQPQKILIECTGYQQGAERNLAVHLVRASVGHRHEEALQHPQHVLGKQLSAFQYGSALQRTGSLNSTLPQQLSLCYPMWLHKNNCNLNIWSHSKGWACVVTLMHSWHPNRVDSPCCSSQCCQRMSGKHCKSVTWITPDKLRSALTCTSLMKSHMRKARPCTHTPS